MYTDVKSLDTCEQCVALRLALPHVYWCKILRYLQNYCNYAAFGKHLSTMTLHLLEFLLCIPLIVIYLYDQTITFCDQIEYIWSRRFSAVTLLFALLHLSTITAYILCVVDMSLTQCQVWTSHLVSMVIKLIIPLDVCLAPHTQLGVALLT